MAGWHCLLALELLLGGVDADRRPREVAGQALEALRVIGHDQLGGVQ